MAKLPKYRTGHSSGIAFAEWKGKRYYLGRENTPESFQRYRKFIQEIELSGVVPPPSSKGLRLIDLVEKYDIHLAEKYPGSASFSEDHREHRRALLPLMELCGSEFTANIGPRQVKTALAKMETSGLSRPVCNTRLLKIKRFFKWAVSEDLFPADRLIAIQTVDGLRKGKAKAPEPDPVAPVDQDTILRTLPHTTPPVAAMIVLQWICGMRPGEVTRMRPCDVDRSEDVWIYRPTKHKNQWRTAGAKSVTATKTTRVIAIPKFVQDVLTPFLDRDPESFCFQPAEATAWRLEHRNHSVKEQRSTKVYPSETRRLAREKAQRRKKPRPTTPYKTASYAKAVKYAVELGNAKLALANPNGGEPIPHWSPNQLRHSAGTEIAAAKGLGQQAAQRWLGHATLDTTSIYVEVQTEEIKRIARDVNDLWKATLPALHLPATVSDPRSAASPPRGRTRKAQ